MFSIVLKPIIRIKKVCIPPQTDTALAQNSELNEAILAAVWNEQSPLRGPMWDCEGRPVAVVYRGRWTAGSGRTIHVIPVTRRISRYGSA